MSGNSNFEPDEIFAMSVFAIVFLIGASCGAGLAVAVVS